MYHDRIYQRYSLTNEINLSPIDDVRNVVFPYCQTDADSGVKEEEDRLLDQHEMLKIVHREWRNRLYPDVVGEPARILDCGYGNGAWAVDAAEWDPDSEVGTGSQQYGRNLNNEAGDRHRHNSAHGSV